MTDFKFKKNFLVAVASDLLSDAQDNLKYAETHLKVILESKTEAQLASNLRNFIENFQCIESHRALADYKIGRTLCRLWEFE